MKEKSTTTRSLLSLGSVAFVGGLVGAVATRCFSPPPPTESGPPLALVGSGRAQAEWYRERIRASDASVERPRPTPIHPELPPPPSSAVVLDGDAYHAARWAQHMAAHEAEPLSPWGREARYTFSEGISEVAPALGATVISVDCRTSSCVALLRWPNYDQARDSIARLTIAQYEPNCTRTTWLPPPDEPSLVYEGALLLECGPEDHAGTASQ